jgi:P27 family predicted phage terminase small subunit
MAKPGPPPTPTALRALHGEPPYRLNPREPQPPTGVPDATAELRSAARVEWDRYSQLLDRTGVLTQVDGAVLEVMVNALVDYREAVRVRGETPMLVRGAKGNLVQNPVTRVVRDQAMLVLRAASLLGCAPAARVGMHLDRPTETIADRLLA